MRRVHRSLQPEHINTLREQLNAQIPSNDLPIAEVIRTMRLIAKRSQSEYAKLCGVAPRVLAEIESGSANPRLATLQALLRPFAYQMGVVRATDPTIVTATKRAAIGKARVSPDAAKAARKTKQGR
ncbi:MAG: helix-turn-helix transcriptional regulator [Steroidobacteraceae bacterium]